MKTKIYGESISRIAVRQITPKIFSITHCIGKDCAKYNGGFAADFARINPNYDPEANDIIYNSYLFLDEKNISHRYSGASTTSHHIRGTWRSSGWSQPGLFMDKSH